VEAARIGFETVRSSMAKHFDEVAPIFAAYGIEMNREGVEEEFEEIVAPDAKEGDIRKVLVTKKEDRKRKEKKPKGKHAKR
jgi:hypothetical protein